jgi:hemerythrin-like domain-containing protein
LSASDTLRKDHQQIKRLEKIITKCYHELYDGKDIPFSDIDIISSIIAEFLDSIHYSREENSYFPCVASYESLNEEIRKFLIEHEFGRRIAHKVAIHLHQWKNGGDAREPVARFLRTYSIYLVDHMKKEDDFFDKAQQTILSKEEEKEMYEQFQSVLVITKKIDEMIKKIDYLENQEWFKN